MKLKRTSVLPDAIANAYDKLKSMQTKHIMGMMILRDEALSTFTIIPDKKLWLLQEKIDSVVVEKDKELEEARSVSEKTLQQ